VQKYKITAEMHLPNSCYKM